jgi:hypothetical protein
MASGELDLAGWQAVAGAISGALATGFIAPDGAAWQAFERVRRAVAIGDRSRAAALLLLVRQHPDAHARWIERFADVLPPGVAPPPSSPGGTTPTLPSGDAGGRARVPQPGRGPADKGKS